MTYKSRNASYTAVSVIFEGEVNSCYTARHPGTEDGREYTLVVIKDHDAVRTLMECMVSHKDGENGVIVEAFSYGREYILVFPYRQERPLGSFFVGEAYDLPQCEEICSNLLLSCISSGLPYPLLYLILTQGKINLTKDNGIFLSYAIDLKDLDRTKNEKDCAVCCAEILLDILSTKQDQKNVSYVLLKKKSENRSYGRFTDLYRDLRIASTPVKKRNILVRIKSFFYRNRDLLFGILFWICLILGIVALVLLFTHMVWGDVPFLRIFFNSFKNIGTESLEQ